MKDEERIANHLKKVLTARNMTLRDLAERMHYDHGNLSRLLSGKRRWTVSHLRNVCAALEIDMSELIPTEERIPIVAVVNGDGTFDYSHVESRLPVHGYLPLPPWLKERGEFSDIRDFYALIMADELDVFSSGSTLLCRRGGKFKSGDFVVCPRESGLGVIGKSHMDDVGLLLSHRPGDIRLPKTHAQLCDKVVAIIFP
jgi:transcriptional regulator with XRE-family HTH domain